MSLSLADKQTVNALSTLLYDFLPASFNNNTSFPIAANRAGVSDCWELNGSKGPAVTNLLSRVLENRRSRFCPLIIQVVEQGTAYRSRKGNPITQEDVEQLNNLLLQLSFKIPELTDSRFLSRLPKKSSTSSEPTTSAPPPKPAPSLPDIKRASELKQQLVSLTGETKDPQGRGYAFERFLNSLFEEHKMAPRESFRNRGEQIDGSFVHRHDTFLFEAKWQSKEVAVQALWAFASKVETKSTWARGLFVSASGFTNDGLHAFR